MLLAAWAVGAVCLFLLYAWLCGRRRRKRRQRDRAKDDEEQQLVGGGFGARTGYTVSGGGLSVSDLGRGVVRQRLHRESSAIMMSPEAHLRPRSFEPRQLPGAQDAGRTNCGSSGKGGGGY